MFGFAGRENMMASSNSKVDSNTYDIAVIGGGASGMVAAIQAKRYSSANTSTPIRVAIFEKNERIGKKLLMTGNGRCNLLNTDTDLEHFHGTDVSFCYPVLEKFTPHEILSFFEEIGVVCTEENGKIFPVSFHAGSVLDSLRLLLSDLGVQIHTGANVASISYSDHKYRILLINGSEYFAESVIIATGGKSAPSTGSDGSGYGLLTAFSHRLIPPLPSIVQLKTDTSFCKPLSGNKIVGEASLTIDGLVVKKERGDILFTDYGLSGPPILQLSGYVARSLFEDQCNNRNRYISISIDFLPGISTDRIYSMLQARKSSYPNRRLEDYLTGLFHKRLAVGLLRQVTDKPLSAHVSSFTEREMHDLADRCKSLEIRVTGTMSFANAQTTAGGIATDQFDAKTMSSIHSPGLFASGEILDIDGDCGGYNLHWAWASGFSAGMAAAAYVTKDHVS
jgi:predicted Rossmann fold flavoprotein